MTAAFALTSSGADASVTKQIINRDAHMDHRMHRRTDVANPPHTVGPLLTAEDTA
jgi:hypothetical protein